MTGEPNCACDAFRHPRPLSIDAGLTVIPRQIATLAEFRRAMLAELPQRPALAAWRARGDQDLGVMLLEMWAYACDVVGFYDETIAHECYLRTARLSPSVRKLVELLGYRPRPAVAARARLAVKADGRRPVTVPAGTAFRSVAFGAEPPQVYEADADTTVHPLLNGWPLVPTRPAAAPAGSGSLLLESRTARVSAGDHLLVLSGNVPAGGVFTAVSVTRGPDGHTVVLDHPRPAALPLATARLLRPGATTTLWTGSLDPQTLSPASTTLVLAGTAVQIRPGDWIIAIGPSGMLPISVRAVGQGSRLVAGGSTFQVGSTTVSTPPLRTAVTVLTLASPWPAAALGTDPSRITVEYAMQTAGTITMPLDVRVTPGAPLQLGTPLEAPPDGSRPAEFVVEDADGVAAELTGALDFTTGVLTPGQGGGLTTALDPPATVFANLIDVSRGETVPQETLGVGDASIAGQSFTLRKKPLTYLSAPTAAAAGGVRSTLTVWVRDIRWTEVPSFFGVAPDAAVFIVRQNDDGDSRVVFGDGVRGARLPSGAPVVATYRFGAGAAVPPPGGITQLARPVKGLTAVRDPLGAAGGDDAQPADRVRTYAPRSALLFGRAVSIEDMEALAAAQPGVRNVQAQWAWDPERQLPTVHIWYIGADTLAGPITAVLRSATAPSTPITATSATPVPVALTVAARVRRDHQPPVVSAAVLAALTTPGSGLLSAERIGVGAPLFRSVLLAEILAVPGVSSVSGLTWRGGAFAEFGYRSGNGEWFQVSVTVNVTPEDQDG